MSQREVFLVPTSFAQERLWLLQQMEPGSGAYNIPAAVRLRGALDPRALAASLTTLRGRHETLRATFAVVEGEAVQVLHPPAPAALPVVDLMALAPGGARDDAASELATAEGRRPFDLARGPLLRTTLIRLAPGEHWLLVTFHHTVADGWSAGIFVRELGSAYRALVEGRAPELPALPIQYGDYAEWQREELAAGRLEADREYWRRRLAGLSPAPLLVPDAPSAPEAEAAPSAHRDRTLPPALSASLRELSRREGVTLFMTLLAAFQLLLGRRAGRRDLAVGTPVAGRSRGETAGLIGVFVNTLVLRADLAGNPPFRRLLARVRETVAGAFAHQELPYEVVLADLRPRGAGRGEALFQVLFNMLSFPAVEIALPGLAVEYLPTPDVGSKLDLTIYAQEGQEGIHLHGVYDTNRLSGATVAELLRQYEHLLEQAVAEPDQPVEGFSLAGPWLHGVLPDATRPLPAAGGEPVQARFAAQARRVPDRVAVTAGDVAWSYDHLAAAGGRLAEGLQQRGLGPGAVVAILAHRGPALAAAVLGALEAGAAFCLLDGDHPPARLASAIRRLRPAAFLRLPVPAPLPPELEEALGPEIPRVELAGGEDARGDESGGEEAGREDARTAGDLEAVAYVAFTSGSTGEPRGVVGTHGPLAHFLDWHRATFGLGDEERFALLSGLSHDPLLRDLFTPLTLGATLAIPEPERITAPGWLAAWLARERITVLHLTPALARLLAVPGSRGSGAAGLDGGETGSLPALRWAFFGGDLLRRREVTRLRRLAPGVTCVNFYGATETPQAMGFQVVAEGEEGEEIPLGRGIDGVQLLVLASGGGLAGVGEVGEIAVRTPHLARGYLEDEEATRRRFIPNPFTGAAGDRLYLSGDLGRYLPDGRVAWVGRADRQVKIRGYRVEPGEVAAALLEHPGIAEAEVVARRIGAVGREPGASGSGGDDGAGSRDLHLVAYAVPAPGAGPEAAELRRFLRSRLPEPLVPGSFVLLDALPLTPNGKVDHAALPDPEGAAGPEAEAFVPPRTPAEEVVAAVWCQLLGVAAVGAHDDFFALGGHSLLATRVMARLQEAFGVELPVGVLFTASTPAALAAEVERLLGEGKAASAPPLERAPRDEDLPLSFAQERIWFLDQLEPGSPQLNLALALELTGPLEAPALAAALAVVMKRHEALRTAFAMVAGRPVQRVEPPPPPGPPRVDLSRLDPGIGAEAARCLRCAEAGRSFDLGRPPLLRGVLLRLAPRRHQLLLTAHHIAADGTSMGLLFQELGRLYAARVSGRPPALPVLPVLPIQMPDFAVWQRRWLTGEALERELAYWRRHLGDEPPVLDLPTDRPRPRLPRLAGGSHRFSLPAGLVASLRRLGREESATPFMVLLAGYALLLGRSAGQSRFLLGTPVANRGRQELEPLIGMFFNLLALRMELGGQPGFRRLVARVRREALAAYAHQDLPFEKLLEELQPERRPGRTPLVEVTFVLQSPPPPLELPGLTVSSLPREGRPANFDLNLQLSELPDGGLAASLEYRSDLFDATTAARLARRWRALLEAAVAEPERPVGELPWLPPAEGHQLLAEWSDTAAPVPESTLHALVRSRAVEAPEAVAVVGRGRHLSYGELATEADGLARRLRRLGVVPGTPVAVGLHRRPEMATALLGVLAAGGFYVPLDPAYPPARMAAILATLEVAHLVCDGPFMPHLAELEAPSLDQVLCLEGAPDGEGSGGALSPDGSRLWRCGELEPAPELLPDLGPDALAYVIFTSGSTGTPKGVAVRHRPATQLVHWVNRTFQVGPGDRVLFVTSLGFDLSVYDLFGLLAAGGTVRVADEEELADPAELVAILRREPVTFWDSAPAALRQLVPFFDAGGATPSPPPQLRRVFLSGDWIPLALPGRVRRAFPRARVVSLGGATEATVWSNFFPLGEIDPPWVSIPYGRPITNARYRILDQAFQPCPMGVPGDLYIGGACLADGYARAPRRTAGSFLPDPFSRRPGERLYRTGDRARWWRDGVMELLGRRDQQVKVRGFRIELGEIETVLGQHPAVQEAVVTAPPRPGEEAGTVGADRRLVAYVVPRPEPEPGADAEEGSAEQVARWGQVYDGVYGRSGAAGPGFDGAFDSPFDPTFDPTFDTSGWVSSYTGRSISRGEMEEWVESTVRALRALKPQRVLEVGCGTGLILFRLASHCREYRATDLSRAAVERLEGQRILRGAELDHLRLEQREAGDWRGLPRGHFDLVVINSVTQHFPSADYLLRVLSGAVAATAPGGTVFVGDVRSLRSLELFHVSVELARAPSSLSREEMARRVAERRAREEELVVDPALFLRLTGRLPAVAGVEVRAKEGRHRNEMTLFRYDALLRVGADGASPATEATPEPAGDGHLDRTALRRRLEEAGDGPVWITGLTDPRLVREVAAREWLAGEGEAGTLGELLAELERAAPAAGPQPQDLRELAAELGWQARVREGEEAGRYEALFVRPAEGKAAVRPWPVAAGSDPPAGETPWRTFTNDPLAGQRARRLVPELRRHLAGRLPDYMVPAAIVLLERLPLTRSGKVDRRALPPPEARRPDEEGAPVAPAGAVEERLAALWAEVLGIDRVGVDDNFFSLGGDSILGIQVVARANREGLGLAPRHLFQHQTVRELAAVVERRQEPAPEAAPAAGEVPLTPIQRWFFEQELADPQHWNLALLLQPRERLSPAPLEEALARLLVHHDALRLGFSRDGSGWRQIQAPVGSRVPLAVVDLAALPSPAARSTLEAAAGRLHAGLDLATAPLLRAALFRLGAQSGGDRLLLTLHHLVVDGVSWRILLADLEAAYRSAAAREPWTPPPRALSYRHWAQALAAAVRSGRVAGEAAFWLAQSEAPVPALPVDHPGGANTEASARRITVELDPEATRALLTEVPPAYNTRIDDALLAALLLAFHRWTGESVLLLDVESHGRDDELAGGDLSGTAGWFTAIYPLRLELPSRRDPGSVLKAVKERLRRVPGNGLGYGLLRYLGEDGVAAELGRRPQAEVIFNNLGRLDRAVARGSLFTAAPEGPGATRSGRARRRHLLEIYAAVQDEGLRLDFEYSRGLHRESTLGRLAGDCRSALLALIDHCRSFAGPGLTTADFPAAELSDEELEGLLTQLE